MTAPVGFALRSVPLRTASRQPVRRAKVHILAISTSPAANSMLHKANQVYEARRPTQGPPPKAGPNRALQTQLFPSSSPTPSSLGNGSDHPNKSHASVSHPSGSAGRATVVTVLSAAPAQNQQVSATTRLPTSRSGPRLESDSKSSKGGLATLYQDTDSFQEDTGVRPGDRALGGLGTKSDPVHFDSDDFSDDDNLALDFACPSVLPSLVPTGKSFVKRTEPSPHGNSSCVSWSQSSPSHYQQPQRASNFTQQGSAKRESPHDDEGAPAAKKRVLPWKKTSKPEPIDLESQEAPATATPMAKSTSALLWHATPGAIKAQKKQLKSQTRKNLLPEYEQFSQQLHEAPAGHSVTKSAPISLSNEQRDVKKLVCEKNASVFFTGPAGTGKSVLMRAIIQDLKKKWAKDPERLAVTASTGLAACNIGGMTLHSFAGIGLGKEDAQTLVKKIRRNPKAKNRWLKTKILIIDEVSMVDGELFDKLSQIGRIIRNNGRPWGGIQLVITGDFFQLPPVPDSDKRDVKFAFEAATWNTSIDHTIGLTEVFRQKDPEFAQMLNEMRLGRISDSTIQSFRSLSRPLQFDDGLEVTELFPTRHEVENSNARRLKSLTGAPVRYEAIDFGEPSIRDKLLQNMMAPKGIELKKGAQVMLIKNMDDTLVNGSLGTVIGFQTKMFFEMHGGEDGYVSGEETGASSDVAKRIQKYEMHLDQNSGKQDKAYPLVRFHGVDGSQRILLCEPEEWKVETPTGEVQASRTQLPLILAWALSIHKAQGQTLERVKVDLGKIFEKGQAYVALSRATTQRGLQVLRFDKSKVMAHPRVVGFYNKLYSAGAAVQKRPIQTIDGFAHTANNTTAKPQPSRMPQRGTNHNGFDEVVGMVGTT